MISFICLRFSGGIFCSRRRTTFAGHLLDKVDGIVEEHSAHDIFKLRIGECVYQQLLLVAVHECKRFRREVLWQNAEYQRYAVTRCLRYYLCNIGRLEILEQLFKLRVLAFLGKLKRLVLLFFYSVYCVEDGLIVLIARVYAYRVYLCIELLGGYILRELIRIGICRCIGGCALG